MLYIYQFTSKGHYVGLVYNNQTKTKRNFKVCTVYRKKRFSKGHTVYKAVNHPNGLYALH